MRQYGCMYVCREAGWPVLPLFFLPFLDEGGVDAGNRSHRHSKKATSSTSRSQALDDGREQSDDGRLFHPMFMRNGDGGGRLGRVVKVGYSLPFIGASR